MTGIHRRECPANSSARQRSNEKKQGGDRSHGSAVRQLRPPGTWWSWEVSLRPGGGHNFHKHPNQEEVIYVLEGEIEQWIDREKRILRPGDSAFIGADVVHASFNVGDRKAKLLAILGPCVGSEGYELVDVAGQEPWVSPR